MIRFSGDEAIYVGRVLRTYRQDVRIMSDVWASALFADVIELDGATRSVEVGGAEIAVDATEPMQALALAYKRRADADLRLRTQERALELCRVPRFAVGDEVATTRKTKRVPRGLLGRVCWVGVDNFSGKPRLGIETSSGERCYVNACSVAMVDQSIRNRAAHEHLVREAESYLRDCKLGRVEAEDDYRAALSAVSREAA